MKSLRHQRACRCAAIVVMALCPLLHAVAQQQQQQQQPEPIEEALIRNVPYFSQDSQPLAKVLQALGRTNGISIMCEKAVEGEVNVEFHNITLRGILDALCAQEGYYWDIEDGGYIMVRRFKTFIYQIEYPTLERKGSSKSSINLGQTGFDASAGGSGGGSTSTSTSGGGRGGAGGGGEDSASVSLEMTTENQFWDKIQQEIDAVKGTDERVVFDRFAGTIMITGSRHTHEHIANFLNNINGRIAQQVEIVGKIIEVQLNDQDKLGIDWELAASSVGNLMLGAAATAGAAAVPGGKSSTNITTSVLGGFQFDGESFTGRIGIGKLDAFIQALSQQGNLNAITSPRLVTLNNQTAYIKDTNDVPYFQRQSTAQMSGGINGNNMSSETYTVSTISIGTTVAITPHIADNGDITLDITPAITRLDKEITAPDDYSKAPALFVKMTSTIIRLRSGETAIIGGLITEQDANTTRSVPGLGKIPFLGRLFRTEAKYKAKSELVIMLTPRILQPGASLSAADQRAAASLSRGVRAHAGAVAPALPRSTSVSSAGSTVEAIPLLD
ncbi:MAG: secretin N-terminal domain-containing protein [Opitutaceae bacterium]|nr:secretin N-terminal domain-containing protein [Opitutaceae bacterium]